MFKSRTPPVSVARHLRQEAGFGCAACGSPILEYHHIIEWHEKQHFDVEHMVALCPTCHTEFGKLPKARSYSVKNNPINIRRGRIHGYLGGNKKQKYLRLGSAKIGECESALNYAGIDLFSYKLVDEEYLLNIFLPDDKFWPEVEVRENNLSAGIDGYWDIEFKTNWVKFKKSKRDLYLAIDFRGEEVEIDANFFVGGERISLNSKKSQFGSTQISNMIIERCQIGVRLGPKGRILRPNFAMRKPAAIHQRH